MNRMEQFNKVVFPTEFVDSGNYIEAPQVQPLLLQNGHKIYYWYEQSQEPCKNTIILSHGNGECLMTVGSFCQEIQEYGMFNVVSYDWEGYGFSVGRPSEEAMHEAIEAVYQLDILKDHKIVLLGNSIGATAAAYLGAKYQLPTILVAGLSDGRQMFKQFQDLPPVMKNDEKAKTIKRLLLIYSKVDKLITFEHGEQIRDLWVAHNRARAINGNEIVDYIGENGAKLTYVALEKGIHNVVVYGHFGFGDWFQDFVAEVFGE